MAMMSTYFLFRERIKRRTKVAERWTSREAARPPFYSAVA
jgi:hypothetical protein